MFCSILMTPQKVQEKHCTQAIDEPYDDDRNNDLNDETV